MSVSAEPALLTFLIADVRGYTRFTVDRGDEAAARLATAFAHIATEVIEPAGGRVVELRGDEALAVFSSARQALRAAIELQRKFAATAREDLPLRVGIGIDAGEAVPVEGGYRGAALNLAARLCSLAGPGEVLASETVTNLARKLDGLSYVERGATDLKGFSSRVMVMQVLPEEQPADLRREETAIEEQRLPIGGFLGALPANSLVARDSEMQRIQSSIRAVRAGEGRLLLLTGEPGVGKTRLAQEVTLQVRNLGFVVASGRCYEPEENVPYYPFRDALGMLYDAAPAGIRADVARLWPYMLQLLPFGAGQGAQDAASGEEEQQRLFYAVTGFIEAVSAAHPVALLLDDLHWADGSSLKLTQYIARHTRTSPVFILGTYRDVEVGRHHPLERALRDLNREGLTEEIAVRRLDQEGTGALTAASFGQSEVSAEFAALLYRHTEGNPFFTHEVLRALVERGDVYEENGRWERREVEEIEVPKSVRSTVGERVSRLESEAQEVLAEASVLGQTFHFDDVQALGERDERIIEDALEAAEAAGLVRSQGRDLYAFNHALTQQVLYDEIPPRRRRRLHLAAGEAIEKGRHPERRVPDLAWHFLQGDDPEKALHYATRAGDEATAVFAHSEAERHFRTAVELAHELGERRQEMDALEKLGNALESTSHFEEAVRRLKEADQLAVELGEREVQRRAVAKALQLIWLQQRTDEELLRRFDELLLDKEPSEGLAAMYLTKARYAFGAGRYEESGEWAEKMSEIARAVGSDYILAEAEARRGTAVAYHDIDQGIAILEGAAMLAERTGNSSALGLSLNNVAFEYMLRGDLQRNLRYRTRALEQAQKVQSPTAQAWGNAMMAQAHHYLGDLEKAREHAEIAVRSVRVMERIWHTSYALYVLAHVKVLAGEVDDAAALIQEGQEIARSHSDLQGMGYGRSIGGELSLLRGEPEKVISMYESVPTADIVSFESWVAAEAYLAVGKADIAEQIAGEMIQPDSWFRSEGLRIRGMIASGRARYDEAENDFSSAMELARTQGYRVEEGRSLYEYGRMLATRGDRDAARKCFGQALRLFREIGAHAYADRTERAISELLAA